MFSFGVVEGTENDIRSGRDCILEQGTTPENPWIVILRHHIHLLIPTEKKQHYFEPQKCQYTNPEEKQTEKEEK